MTTSALRRQVKNIVHNYSEAEIKVREATSNDPWGPPSSLMSEIADLTFNTVAFAEVMGMIWRRLNDSGKNWRHVYKALTLLDYLIKTGSEKVTHQCRENLYTIQTLKDFQYVDRDGKDQGINIREKVKQVMALLKDEERLKQERAHALQTKERMALEGMGILMPLLPLFLFYLLASSSSPRFASDLEQARPQTTGEEELQLQLALAMSREEAEKPLPPISSTDEERQLQLALALSKEEHEKVPVPRSPGRSSLLALGLFSGALEPETPPRSSACFAFTALGSLLSALPGGSAPEEPSARMLGLFGDALAAPVLGLSPGEGAGGRAAELMGPVPCPCRR
uniref:Epsin 3 n=1 Tax=Bubo bubo TaxID=30461 RepID=A0A8C0FGF0_BUBBB